MTSRQREDTEQHARQVTVAVATAGPGLCEPSLVAGTPRELAARPLCY